MVILSWIDPQTNQLLHNWNFSAPEVIRLGRHPDNDVVFLDYPQVSRHHAELRKVELSSSESGWQLINIGANGTFVNGFLTSQTLIKDNDLIRLSQHGPLVKFQIAAKTKKSPLINSLCTHEGNLATSIFCQYCGEPIVETQQFVHYFQILRTLGQGGMGTTYLAWDKKGVIDGSPKLMVLKEMNADMAAIAKARELFDREARILQSISHPGVPKFYNFFVDNNKKYLAMELIHGDNLENYILQKGPVTTKQAIEWMIQLCGILSYLHSLNPPLVHRDVKPANLLLKSVDNRILLIDFGAVKEIGTASGTRIGAEGYAAPEQNLGKPCPQSDIYAIGPTIIFLVTGMRPLKFQNRKDTNSSFDFSAIPSISFELAQVINKATQMKAGDRYKSAQELAQALARCI